jgi:hypothetical protein
MRLVGRLTDRDVVLICIPILNERDTGQAHGRYLFAINVSKYYRLINYRSTLLVFNNKTLEFELVDVPSDYVGQVILRPHN